MMKFLVVLVFVIVAIALFMQKPPPREKTRFWQVQSIDTMKYSRDLAQEKANDASFNRVIETHVRNIKATGATHVAIGTPYDEEFLPFLQRWVAAARRHNLHVWFRGNFAGWEEWFSYPAIDRQEHKKKIEEFILSHPDLFSDGDIFSACPECENGGPGDPRHTEEIASYQQFLIDEYALTKQAFKKIGKQVSSNYNSMNADVAAIIMDRETTKALDGIVVIDHYVNIPSQLSQDVERIAAFSGGRVMIGEFGVPIPDIHGNLSEDEQAAWLSDLFEKLIHNKQLVGINYWVSVGGTTALWNERATPKKAVSVITRAYAPLVFKGYVKNTSYQPIANVTVRIGSSQTETNQDGFFSLPVFLKPETIILKKEGYRAKTISGEKQNIGTIVLKQDFPAFLTR